MKELQKKDTNEELTKEEQKIASQITKIVIERVTKIQAFQSPIPPPEIIEGYERIIPGSAERILAMAEQQVDHRIQVEKDIVKSSIKQKWVGLIIGGVSLFVILPIGFYFATHGLAWLAGIIFTTTLLGVLAIWVLGKFPTQKKAQ